MKNEDRDTAQEQLLMLYRTVHSDIDKMKAYMATAQATLHKILWLLCGACNSSKGTKSQAEFIGERMRAGHSVADWMLTERGALVK